MAGDGKRDGAAVLVLAGARRLHLEALREEGYLVDMVTHRGVAGKHAGDEALRR